MADRGHPSISVSIADPELRTFVREQAGLFFGGRIAGYVGFLLDLDRRDGLTREEMRRRIATIESGVEVDAVALAS